MFYKIMQLLFFGFLLPQILLVITLFLFKLLAIIIYDKLYKSVLVKILFLRIVQLLI